MVHSLSLFRNAIAASLSLFVFAALVACGQDTGGSLATRGLDLGNRFEQNGHSNGAQRTAARSSDFFGLDYAHAHGPGCADPLEIGPVRFVERPIGMDSGEAVLQSHSALAAAGMFCPAGFSWDEDLYMCTNGNEALGPFPPAMVERCKSFGGGPACSGSRWGVDFAASIRGEGVCPLGSSTRSGGYCASGASAYGPFSIAEVKACEAARGGAPCQGMVWNLEFAESLIVKDDPAKPLQGLRVAIDSGHGGNPAGHELGVISPFHGAAVSDYLLNLATTTEVSDMLRRRGARVSLYQYRQPYVGPSLEGKGAVARGSHVFLSVHHNGANRSAQGSEVFVHSGWASQADNRLAFRIQDRLVNEVWGGGAAFDRGVKSANFGVLRGAAPLSEAAVLVESFFIDVPQSVETFEVWRRRSVRAIADGVTLYWMHR